MSVSARLAELQRASQALGLSLSSPQCEQLLAYADLLLKWTRVYNLTAVRDPSEVLTHHLFDSLAVVAPLQRELARMSVPSPRLLDVGSGGGLPGAVLAMTCPQLQVTCVDAVAKKTAFVQQVATQLSLSNLRAVHARVESLAGPFDVICSRAFASLADFTALSKRALATHGIWMAMKGRSPDDELAALPANVSAFHVEPLQVPGLKAER